MIGDSGDNVVLDLRLGGLLQNGCLMIGPDLGHCEVRPPSNSQEMKSLMNSRLLIKPVGWGVIWSLHVMGLGAEAPKIPLDKLYAMDIKEVPAEVRVTDMLDSYGRARLDGTCQHSCPKLLCRLF
jgi:hypothetical protein